MRANLGNNRWKYLSLGLLALACGYCWNLAGSQERGDETAENVAATKSDSGGKSRQRDAVIQGLTRLQRSEGGEDNWLRWVAELENAKRADLPRFLEHLPERSGLAMDLLAERWFDLGPEEAFDYFAKRFQDGEMAVGYSSKESQLSLDLVRLWAKRDLEGVVAAVEGVEAFPYLEEVHRTLAPLLCKSDPERGLRYALEHGMHRGGYYFFLGNKEVRKLIDRNPKVAGELMFEWGESRTKKARKELVKRWGVNHPMEAIRFGLERGDSIGGTFAHEVFVAWAQKDYEEASVWVAEEASDEEAELFIVPLVDVWSQEEPVAALQWAEEQLTGAAQEGAVTRLVAGAIDRKDVDAGELLQMVESPELYQQAAEALAKQLREVSDRSSDENRVKLLEKLAWFDQVTDAQTLNGVIGDLMSVAKQADSEWVVDFARSERMSALDQNQAVMLLWELADNKHFEKGLEMVEFVAEEHRDECLTDMVERWFSRDPERSSAWLEEKGVTPIQRSMLSEKMLQTFFSGVAEGDLKAIREKAETYPEPMKALVREGVRKHQMIAETRGYQEEASTRMIKDVLEVLSE